MKDAIGSAVLRGTLASVAGVAAMDLYFKLLKSVQSRGESEGSRRQQGQGGGQPDEQREAWRGEQGQREPWRPEEAEQEAWRGGASSREQQTEAWEREGGRRSESWEEPRAGETRGGQGATGRTSGEPWEGEYVEGRSAWQGGERQSPPESPLSGDSGERPESSGEGNGHGPNAARRIWRRFTKNRVLDDISVIEPPRKEGEPPTVAVGRIAYEAIRHREPSRETGAQLGKVVHWTYGLAMGGVYGLLDPEIQDREIAAGLGYGAALWLLGDELLVPMLGLAKGPTAHPPSVHVEAFGAHLVYGLVTATANKALRAVI